MERVITKPVAFILILSLIFGAFMVPCYADSSIYSEASLVNGVDTSFEKQSEIAEVKAQSYDGARTLNSDSHSGRFSLKIGKSGLTGSALCNIISSDIDLTKYNQVSLWVKPKGYNIPISIYTDLEGVQVTIGSIEVSDLKADVWQQVSLDLPTASAAEMTGLYTYGYNNKSLLIDDIAFTKSYMSEETWDLGASGPNNTLPVEMKYQKSIGISLQRDTTDQSLYNIVPKVGYIQNNLLGQIQDISITSGSTDPAASLTGQSISLDPIIANNPYLYTISKDCSRVYYFNYVNKCVEMRDFYLNLTKQIYNGPVKQIQTNSNGSMLALVATASSLYLVTNAATSASFGSITMHAITTGAITIISLQDGFLYYVNNDLLYKYNTETETNTKIGVINYFNIFNADPENASQVSANQYKYSYYLFAGSGSVGLKRHDNRVQQTDVELYSYGIGGNYLKANSIGNMAVIFNYYSNGSYSHLYHLIYNLDTQTPFMVNLNQSISSPLFNQDQLIYSVGSQLFKIDSYKKSPVSINSINYSIDTDESDGRLLYAENYSSLYLTTKTYSYDKELLVQFSTTSAITKPASNSAITCAKFSTLPNQVITQMENGDIYSIDSRTKTSRLIINKMVLHDVLSNGRLLLSDMTDTGRFLIYDPTTNTKEVFRLDNRNTSASFTIQFNEDTKTVYYLNNENKIQVLPLTGASTSDKYAFMLNNDSKWWVYQNNSWKTIYTGSDNPPAEIMDSMGMTAAEVNGITEKDFLKLPENAKPDTLRIAVYFNSNSPYATPVLKGISVSTKDAEADLDSKTAYGTRIKEYNKADFRNVSAIHVTENKGSTDEIFYFLVADDTPYSIRNGEVCDIDLSATQLFGNVKDNYMDIMSYGMNAKELADFPADSLKEVLITDNQTDKFGIVAVIKTVNKDTKDVKLDYVLESLQKRFDDSVTTVKILLTDDTLIQYTSGEVTKEEIEKFADWVMDRKYNRGPVFFTFHVGNQYKVINYYMIKMFSVE